MPIIFTYFSLLAILLSSTNVFAVDVDASDGEFTDRIEVSWTRDDTARNYTLYRCTSTDLQSCVSIAKSSSDGALKFSDFDAVPLQVYQYRVEVCNFVLCDGLSEPDSGYRASVVADDFGDSCNEAAGLGENSSVAGNLEAAGDLDYFRVEVSVAGVLTVNTAGDTNTTGRLKDAGCSDIASADDGGVGANFELSAQLQPGIYYVEVGGQSSAIGAYQLNSRLDPNDDLGNSCNEARQIDPNSQLNGSLEVAGDVDYVYIPLLSSGTLTLNTTGGTDTYGSLKDANCSTIAESDGGGEGGNFQIDANLSPGGYFLEVRGANGGVSGGYQLQSQFSAEDDYGNFCETATLFDNNASLPGVLEVDGDTDYFRISVPVRGTLEMYTTGGTDTFGYFGNANCELVTVNDDSGEGRNFLISIEVAAGDYFIVVGGYNDTSTGAYEVFNSFTVSPDTGGSCGAARSISVNGSTPDEIETGGDYDFFRLEFGRPGTLSLNSAGAVDLVGTLRDANCNYVTEDDDSGEERNFLIQQYVSAGTYFLETRAYFSNDTGPYEIQSSFEEDDDYGGSCAEAADISIESLSDGQIEVQGDHDFFRLELAVDTPVFIQTVGETDTYAWLRDANCAALRRDDDSGEGRNFRIATFLPAGVYYLDVSGYGETTTGPYQLYVSTADDGNGVDLTINPAMNDAWFNPATNGQGFFMTVFPQYRIIFVSWYTYEAFHPEAGVASNIGDPSHRWYTAIGSIYGNEAFLELELTTGGLFNADQAVEQTYPGSLYIRFDDCSNAIMAYDLPDLGISGQIPVTRIAQDNAPVCEVLGYYTGDLIVDQQQANSARSKPGSPTIQVQGDEQPGLESDPILPLNYGFNDAWYNPLWPGQGFFVTVLPSLNAVAVAWFTFDSEHPDEQTPFTIGDPGHRWFVASGALDFNRADMDITLARNGLFDSSPETVTFESGGTMSIEFDNCYSGRITYFLEQTGESGEIPIVRALEDEITLDGCLNPFQVDSAQSPE